MASPPSPAEKPSDSQTLDPLVSPSPPLSPADQQSLLPAADLSAPKAAAEATPAKAEGSEAVEGGEATEQEAKDDGSEEEEMECGFCLFMKGGGCKDAFIAWEDCITVARDTGEDAAEKCMEVTSALMKCMEAHPDYYEPILRAEKAMTDSITDSGDDDPESEKKVEDD
ncbi:uncharacterized protein LOC121972914 [Zingiber officinale]|uniref:GCK domain-containing protein n=1 Tax=Zingiber officinale TaxID=94328 RepID=A0A8J5GYS2_ZINOF|nr:uncharacterized protein LOC121972914 [Zingiber officinale]KAG6516172.1 hypothetical protein ZIOFF_026621 [Zingiber officinale]